jgi:cyclic pyranopterin phosphate synthase
MDNTRSSKLLDPFGRLITTMRISITDKCNFRCIYCMPAEGIPLKSHQDILRYEQVAEIVHVAAALGIHKIKLTGGEPLVRRNIEFIIRQIAAIPGITDLGMTTNASLLTPEKARLLKEAGLMRINISLDSLDPTRFRAITRGGEIAPVMRGIDAALEAGLTPVKINMVIMEDTPFTAVTEMKRFCVSKGLSMQTITHFSLGNRNMPRALATDRPPPCFTCNRLRLTADGFLKPCLFTDQEIRVDMNDIEASLLEAIDMKPETGYSCNNRSMRQIGG